MDNKQYSRNFKDGEYRYATRALIENGFVIIHQTERRDNPKMEYRSSITLSIKDFKSMIKTLGI